MQLLLLGTMAQIVKIRPKLHETGHIFWALGQMIATTHKLLLCLKGTSCIFISEAGIQA